MTVKAKTATAENITQRYIQVAGPRKMDALTRLLEVESFEAMIVFVRTKQATEEVAEKLRARGFSAAAINGDIPQAQRERTIAALKDGSIDILVATDVAARGLDVERISHVLNYDIPHDTESYVHRIGRTGRAGRSGAGAAVRVTPRAAHAQVHRKGDPADSSPRPNCPPSTTSTPSASRSSATRSPTRSALRASNCSAGMIEDYERENDVPMVDIAAALAAQSRDGEQFLMSPNPRRRSVAGTTDRRSPTGPTATS